MSLQKTYHNLLRKRFVLINSIQTGILMSISDLISQTVVEKKPWKPQRTLEFSFLGLALVGPAVSVWYKFLARKFGHSAEPGTVLKKMACDQLIFAPGFLAVFVSSLGLVQGNNREQLKVKLRDEYGQILITNWKIWPVAQIINFYFMPLNFQVLFAQSMALLWNIYLSNVTQGKGADGV